MATRNASCKYTTEEVDNNYRPYAAKREFKVEYSTSGDVLIITDENDEAILSGDTEKIKALLTAIKGVDYEGFIFDSL